MTDWHVKTALYSALVFAILIAFLFLFTFGKEEEMAPAVSEASQEPTLAPLNSGQETRVIEDDKNARPDVTYTANGFSPGEIHADADASSRLGCFVRIKNASSGELVIRLGPFESGKEKGVLYAPIASGDKAIIDPRYSNFLEVLFYNKLMPAHLFRVVVSPTCF